jgi:hypothetical protein
MPTFIRLSHASAKLSTRTLLPGPVPQRGFFLAEPFRSSISPVDIGRERAAAVRDYSVSPSVAFQSDVLHPKVKAVSFICVFDKEVLKSVLPVCRGERLFTDSAMEQATWKSRLRTHANEFVS